MSETSIQGAYTGIDLSDTAPLTAPWEPDRFGRMMPALSLGLLRLSAELAADTYTLRVEDWLSAGWQDAAIQVENSLSDGLDGDDLASSVRLQSLRNQVNRRDPFNEAIGGIRQLRATDTGKALVMVHPAPDGRWVVAISFMGTVARLYDWFANFRMASEEGFHQGFLALARQFEANEESIRFPKTAKALGLEHLTLRDVLAEACQPDSRFLLWLTGHSQGGAVMQVYTHLKCQAGVLPQNMVGVGFASPSVAKGGAVENPAAYPLWLVMNSDDVVPRFGAVVHLGQCLIYPAGQSLRENCYNWPRDRKSVENRLLARRIMQGMQSTAGGIEVGSGLLLVLGQAQASDFIPALNLLSPGMSGFRTANPTAEGLVGFITRRAAAAYETIYDHPVSQETIHHWESICHELMTALGIGETMAALAQLALNPHSMYPKDDAPDGAYMWIVVNGAASLLPAYWTGEQQPRLVRAERMAHVHGSRLQTGIRNVSRRPSSHRRARRLPTGSRYKERK